MTAPKVMWRETIAPNGMYPNGGSFYYEAGKPETVSVARYIRADAPEWVALVALIRDRIETSSEFQSQWDRDALAALAAYEALK